MEQLKDQAFKELTKSGLPICKILIYFALVLLIIRTEPIWGTLGVVFYFGLLALSWWVTKNEPNSVIPTDADF